MHSFSSCSRSISISIYSPAAASWTSCSRFICQTSLVNYTLLQLVQMYVPPAFRFPLSTFFFSTARNVLFTRWNIINYMRAFCHSSCVYASSNWIRLSDCFGPSCDGLAHMHMFFCSPPPLATPPMRGNLPLTCILKNFRLCNRPEHRSQTQAIIYFAYFSVFLCRVNMEIASILRGNFIHEVQSLFSLFVRFQVF